MSAYWPHITAFAALDTILVLLVIPWVLLTKREPTAAVAWCLVVLLVPLFGTLLFWGFGYNFLLRRVRQERFQRSRFHEHPFPPDDKEESAPAAGSTRKELAELALQVNAYPTCPGNSVALFHETEAAFSALLAAIAAAQHHVHLEYYILRSDATGNQLFELLTQKAKEGVQVRVLYDAMGCVHLRNKTLQPLVQAGGQVVAFLPLNPLRSRIRFNLRNHRKITIVDGRVGFTGGMNIGDEYLGKSPKFGYWRDAVVRLEGPAVVDLQHIFNDDWVFAAHESLQGSDYFPTHTPVGDDTVQIAASGPDQEINTIREIYFMAMLSARHRLWMASPYFIPDSGIVDALRLACYRGVDVRLLSLSRPDHYVSYYAGRYYWSDLLNIGVKVYQYEKGMMHSKLMMVDEHWAMIGSANLDIRSLRLDFEAGCILHSPASVAELEEAYLQDLQVSQELNVKTYEQRSRLARVVENACRLLSPAL